MKSSKPDRFEGTALVKEIHARMVADMDNVAKDANILPHWIWTPLAQANITAEEVDWVKRFKFHENAGACLVGRSPEVMPETRMAAIAGALTRNFIRARVMTIAAFIDAVNDADVPDMTCLLIPNFYTEKTGKEPFPSWKAALIYDGLLQRQSMGLQTVLYVPDMASLGADFGGAMEKHLTNAYDQIKIS